MASGPLLHPRGPLPTPVYWRRRLLTLLAVAAVLALLARACTGGGGHPAARISQSPSPHPSVTSSVSPRPSTSPSVAAVGPCSPAVLLVRAMADAASYPPGMSPVLTLSVQNSSDAACTRDLGPAARELHVVSGNDRIWSSDDCATGETHQTVTLRAGETRSFRTVWNRHRSRPGCPSGLPAALPGTYRVLGRVGDASATGDVFTLR